MDATTPQPWYRTSSGLLALLLLFFAALSVQYAFKASEGDGKRSAIQRWQDQLLAFQDGENVFEKHAYPNPPIMAMILLPIANWPELVGTPEWTGALLWFYLKVAMALLCMRWVFAMLETPERPFPLWARALAVLLALRPLAGDLSHGNVNLFILFLVVGGLRLFHRGRDFWGGLVLALAMACKVTPALFVGYLVWKRATRALVGVAVGLALFFWPGFVPAGYLGWEENQLHLRSWWGQMVKPFLIDGFVTSEHPNQSLPGLTYRLLTESPSFVVYPNNVWTPARYHNLVSLPRESARWLIKGFMLLFVLFVAWTCRTSRQEKEGRPAWQDPERAPRLVAEYAVVVLGMLLFSERTWKHHCVTFLLPFSVLSYWLAMGWQDRLIRRRLILALGLATLLTSATSVSLLGKESGKLAQVYGTYVAAYFVLLAGLTQVLRGRFPPAADAAREVTPRPLRACA